MLADDLTLILTNLGSVENALKLLFNSHNVQDLKLT